MFTPISSTINFPELEEKILKFWKENKIFEKSIASRPQDKRWTFLDGPPFVTGVPHYGSLLSSLPKDLFGRYWTMKGYRVRRVWGWDGHGLPIENKVENKLKLKSKREIEEKVGVKKFIEECKYYVREVSAEWEWYVDHIGRWVDFKNAYKTWDTAYMESVMWVFKQMYDKGFIYKGLRVTLYCPHCATPISNFEVAMDADNYQPRTDPATTYKYELQGEKGTYILAWSTTPWNKIATPALAVNPELDYVKVKQGDEFYILAEAATKILKTEPKWQVVDTFKGTALAGKKFVAHYDYYPISSGEKSFEIIPGNFVTPVEGTGVVTIAAYGEEDLKAMSEHGVHIEMHVDEEGVIRENVPKFAGMYYLDANKAVNEDLASRGLIYKDEQVTRDVALCWRCHTRLYYAPIDAWYIDVQTLKPLLAKTNELVNWFPKHFKYGRFLKSLENAPDWNISRNRYWGSPVPVWECECGERFVPGSIKELEEASGRKVIDLHKPEIDEITIPCKKCGTEVHRVPEVLDSWIEAGSASFAERHFPFNQQEKLADFFPPDFIAEYTGQIRAWFYVLHVIGAVLYESPAFKNVVVEGVILGNDGRKMSKNYGNYPDPKTMIQTYGGDALRLYLMGSPVMHGEDILISEEQYRNQVKDFLLILWNLYKFFVTYAEIDGWTPQKASKKSLENVLDTWILFRLQQVVKTVTASLEQYDTVASIAMLKDFINDLSTWYIRRSRDRVGPSVVDTGDKLAFYTTSQTVLTTLSRLLAPIAPFISEAIYRNLTNEESVHLTIWPEFDEQHLKSKTALLSLANMKDVRRVVELGHAQRKQHGIKVRQPLELAKVKGPSLINENSWFLVRDDLNVKKIEWDGYAKDWEVVLETNLTPELKAEGQARELVRQVQGLRKEAGCRLDQSIKLKLPEGAPKAYLEYIKRETLAEEIIWGDRLEILTGS